MSGLITPEWCRERDACYADDELVGVLGAGKTVLEVLDLDIPAEHRVWAILRWLPARELRIFLGDTLSRLIARELAAGRELDHRKIAVLTTFEAGRWPTLEEGDVTAWASALVSVWTAEWVALGGTLTAAHEAQIACLRRLVAKVQAKEPQCQS